MLPVTVAVARSVIPVPASPQCARNLNEAAGAIMMDSELCSVSARCLPVPQGLLCRGRSGGFCQVGSCGGCSVARGALLAAPPRPLACSDLGDGARNTQHDATRIRLGATVGDIDGPGPGDRGPR